MASNKQNIVRENKSLEEFDMTAVNQAISAVQQNVQAILSSQQVIYYGTDIPSNSLGKNGDVYIRYID